MPEIRRFIRLVATLLAITVVAACATLPEPAPMPPTRAVVASERTDLGRIALAARPEVELTGFRLLPAGDDALATRLELVRRAEVSLDVQYYQIVDDATGRSFLRALRDAALRGVRVRLLIDDLYTAGEDELLLGLAATPNLELRLFNPFPAGRGGFASRFAASLFDFDRVNRRMHNKLFVADGAIAVVGGRNIGDAYFKQSRGDNFVDLDVAVVGALVPRLGVLFDRYWNSEFVRPIGTVVRHDASPVELAHRFDRATDPATRPPAPDDAPGDGRFVDELCSGRLDLIWAVAEAWADDPGRVVGRQVSYGGVPLLDVESVRYNVRERMRRARSEVTLVSPYLIPGREGLEAIDEVRGRGVRLALVTNSLASTDEPLVYGAYRRHRPDLLRHGVDIWEVSATRTTQSVRLGLLGSRTGRLHSKLAVFDREAFFIGSMNLDPRSDAHNTEIGVFVDSRPLAAEVMRLIDTLKQQGSYHVRLAADGHGIEWVDGKGDTQRVLTSDPDADAWTRFKVDLLSPLIPESLL
ncbi:MAG: phospholipase D family protein [Rubrivivax sp.]|nr:phospholipase D family protein [Rubrivivax sp.]